MTIIPKLLLDERDLQPFVEAYKKQAGIDKNVEVIIESIVPVTTGNGKWTLEMGLAPVKH